MQDIGSVPDSAHRFTSKEGSDSSRDQLSSVKLKFLDDSQVIASIALDSTVGQFKRLSFILSDNSQSCWTFLLE